MTKIEKISYDIAYYVTHEYKNNDIRNLREFIEKRIKEIEEKLKVEITVTNEKFEVDDLVCDGIKVIKATPKLVDAQCLIGRRNWRKVKY